MFKLLAIRPLEGCASHIQKCLKTGMMYYFCNDYIIEPGSHIRRRSKNIKPLKEDFFTVVSESNYSEDNSSERKSPTVSVSAIVGMNGDGKSTLVELMMRLINNCAISYELCASSDNSEGEDDAKKEPHYNLRRVENVKAELYYMIDNVVYRMAEEKDQKETRIWKVLELNPFNEKGEELMRWEIDSVEIQKVEDDPKGFFFTIVSNYSHYAYNIYDYEKEWEIRGGEKEDDEKCWLHYVFHKNDGYLTPITLHPYRYNGNIDINVEKDLSKQRLLSLFLDTENPSKNEHSFRRVNGKDANVLKLTEVMESKLQQKTIIEYFETTIREDRFNAIIEEIDRVNDEIFRAYSLLDSGDDYYKDYNNLVESLLPIHFVNPIKEIIEQDKGSFSVFANNVADWLKSRTKNKKAQLNGDIMKVISSYDNLYNKNKTYIQIGKLNNNAKKNESEGNYGKAMKFYNKAIQTSEAKLGIDHPFIVTTYDSIAGLYGKLGDYDKAMEYYGKSLEIKENTLGKEYPSIATSYSNIGLVYQNKGDYDKAMEYYLKALLIKEKVLGIEHPSTATSYSNIGSMYDALGEYDKALEFYMKALEIFEVLDKDHHLAAASYNNIGLVYQNKGDYDKALEYYGKALKIREAKLGKDLPDTAATYNNIALVHYDRGEYDKALAFYSKALEICVKVLGKNHLSTAALYNNIGLIYQNKGDYGKAMKYYEKSLKIEEKVLGKEHPNIATTYNNIGFVYIDEGNYNDALYYHLEAMKIREKALGTKHPDTVASYYNVAWLSMKQGNFVESEKYYKKAKEIEESKKGESHADIEVANSTITKEIGVSDTHYKNVEQNENGELYRQLENKISSSVGKGELDKIWENDDVERKELSIEKQELLDMKKHRFLSSINATQLGRLDTIYRIIKSYNIDLIDLTKKIDAKIVTRNYSDLSLKEKCQHYIIYKICSIISSYPQYQKAKDKDSIESVREFGSALEESVKDILNDNQSHVTRKLRQVENFMSKGFHIKGLYVRSNKSNDSLLVEIDKLKQQYESNTISLDNLPPPIYKWDILFQKKEDPNCVIEFDSFSSGEKQLLYSISAIIYHLQNLANTSSEVKYNNVNLIMEEIELYYHPEYQRKFFSRLLDLIKRAELGNIQNISIVFVTHSPFILSDIPKSNVLFLKEGMPKDIMQENTFGANIHTLLKNGFFMPNLPIGEFAYEKINKLFGKLNSGELDPDNDLDEIYQEILLVGEPFLRNQLLMLYNSYKGSRVMPMNTNKKGTKS